MSDKDLSEEEKNKKEKEVAKRLEEIKNRLKKSNKSKPSSTDPGKTEKAASSQAKSETASSTKKDQKIDPKKHDATPKESQSSSQDNSKKVSKPEMKESGGFKMAGKPTKDSTWAGNKVKSDDTKPKAPKDFKTKTTETKSAKFKPEINTKPKKKRRTLLVLTFVVLVLVASALVWFFLILPTSEQNKELMTKVAGSETILNDDATAGENLDSGEEELTMMDSETSSESPEFSEDIGNTNAFSSENVSESSSIEEKVEQTPSSENKPKAIAKPPTSNISKSQLNTPCFVISYVSVSSESKAKDQVASLKNKGLSAGYYWIPDYTEGGSELFKVFVGPYPNRQSAHGDLDRIRGFKKDVYYHIVE